MYSEMAQVVRERLKAEITDTATAGLSGVRVWHEERPQQGGVPYVVFRVDTSMRGAGTAAVRDLIVEVDCVAPSASAAGVLATAAGAALEEYTAVQGDVRIAGLQLTGSNRDNDSETGLWYASLRLQGLVIA